MQHDAGGTVGGRRAWPDLAVVDPALLLAVQSLAHEPLHPYSNRAISKIIVIVVQLYAYQGHTCLQQCAGLEQSFKPSKCLVCFLKKWGLKTLLERVGGEASCNVRSGLHMPSAMCSPTATLELRSKRA